MCMTVHLLKPSLRVGGCIAAVLVPIKVSLTLLRASIVSLAVSIITVSRNTPLDAPSPQATQPTWAVEKVRVFLIVQAESLPSPPPQFPQNLRLMALCLFEVVLPV